MYYYAQKITKLNWDWRTSEITNIPGQVKLQIYPSCDGHMGWANNHNKRLLNPMANSTMKVYKKDQIYKS